MVLATYDSDEDICRGLQSEVQITHAQGFQAQQSAQRNSHYS